jgi:putative ABC transport system substrate-binding protein
VIAHPDGTHNSQKILVDWCYRLLQTSAAGGPAMDHDVGRRKCLAVLGGALVWPLAARAQPDGRVRRIGILSIFEQNDPINPPQLTALRESLAKLGWIEGHNVRFDIRYSGGDSRRLQTLADDLVHSAPDLLVVSSGPATRILQRQTRTIPIVFVNVGDPVASGLVTNIARPEGNMTGFTNFFESIASKWLELLKEAAPQMARVALVFVPEVVNDITFLTLEAAAKSLALTTTRTPYRDPSELERAIEAFASEPNGALVILPPPQPIDSRALLTRLALKHRLPTIYAYRSAAIEGGLMSYGANAFETYRAAAVYVDRILRGTKVSELPVQFPTKFDLVINLKTAKAIELDIPAPLTARADELIE